MTLSIEMQCQNNNHTQIIMQTFIWDFMQENLKNECHHTLRKFGDKSLITDDLFAFTHIEIRLIEIYSIHTHTTFYWWDVEKQKQKLHTHTQDIWFIWWEKKQTKWFRFFIVLLASRFHHSNQFDKKKYLMQRTLLLSLQMLMNITKALLFMNRQKNKNEKNTNKQKYYKKCIDIYILLYIHPKLYRTK